MKQLLLLLVLSLFLAGTASASDIDKEMAYINSITSSSAPPLAFESTLPTIEPIIIPEPEEVQIVKAAE